MKVVLGHAREISWNSGAGEEKIFFFYVCMYEPERQETPLAPSCFIFRPGVDGCSREVVVVKLPFVCLFVRPGAVIVTDPLFLIISLLMVEMLRTCCKCSKP